MTAALVSVLMIGSGYLHIGLYWAPTVAGLLVYLLSGLTQKHYAWSCFAAVSVLSLLLSPNKESVVCFVLFLGYYPLVKSTLEKIRVKVIQYLLKLVLFNAAVAGAYCILTWVFSVSADTFQFFGIPVFAVFVVVVNVAFVIYDYAITLFDRKYRTSFLNLVTKLFPL